VFVLEARVSHRWQAQVAPLILFGGSMFRTSFVQSLGTLCKQSICQRLIEIKSSFSQWCIWAAVSGGPKCSHFGSGSLVSGSPWHWGVGDKKPQLVAQLTHPFLRTKGNTWRCLIWCPFFWNKFALVSSPFTFLFWQAATFSNFQTSQFLVSILGRVSRATSA
jgi:hypothetical protein